MKDVTQTLDPLLTTENKIHTPAKKAKWHLGKWKILFESLYKSLPMEMNSDRNLSIFVRWLT